MNLRGIDPSARRSRPTAATASAARRLAATAATAAVAAAALSAGPLALGLPGGVAAAQAQTACHLLDVGDTVPAGYGAPYDVVSASKELLLEVACDGTRATVSVGSGSSSQYVYRYGYQWKNKQWQRIELTGSGLQGGAWYPKQARTALSRTAAELSEDNYVVAHVCTWTGSAWKCGCRDQTCAQPYWQIQGFAHSEAKSGSKAKSGSRAGELWVGPGEQYRYVRDAAAVAQDGDTIYVRAGTYENDFATIKAAVSIIGVGGKAHFKATSSPPNRKAIFVTQKSVTIENLEFSGCKVADGNGAGIRHEGGTLTVKNSYFHGNQNSILTTHGATMSVTIAGSEFARNGYNAYTHGLYIGRIAKLEVRDSYFHDTTTGHLLKSRAAETVIERSRFEDGADGTASRQIDLPNGGKAVIRDSVLYKGPAASQGDMISFGVEGSVHAGSVLRVEGTKITSKRRSGPTTGVRNVSGTNVTFASNNTYDGVHYLATGQHQQE